MDKKEQSNARVKRYREKQKEAQNDVTQGENVTLDDVTHPDSVTPSDVLKDMAHPILRHLVPGKKRNALGKILDQFGGRKELLEATFLAGLPLDRVAELYAATPTKDSGPVEEYPVVQPFTMPDLPARAPKCVGCGKAVPKGDNCCRDCWKAS